MTQLAVTARRQARFLSGRVIVPTGVHEDTWYDVCIGRRHDDRRTGMVLIDVGMRRLHAPSTCLEFRDVPLSVAVRRPLARLGGIPVHTLTRPRLAVAASVVAAVVAVSRYALSK